MTRRTATLSLLTLDVAAWVTGFMAAAWTRFEFDLTAWHAALVLASALVCAVVHTRISQLWLTVAGRHPVGSADEARNLAATVTLAVTAMLASLLPLAERPVPATTPLLGGAVALLLMVSVRAGYRHYRDRRDRPASRTLVHGVDAASERLVRALLGDPRSRYLPVGLLDDDPDRRPLRLHGLRVLGGRADIQQVIRRTRATTVIFSMSGTTPTCCTTSAAGRCRPGPRSRCCPRSANCSSGRWRSPTYGTSSSPTCSGRAHRAAERRPDRSVSWATPSG